MEDKLSLPYSQDPAIGTYPAPNYTIPHSHNIYLKYTLILSLQCL